jgi:hypothetical protein
MGRLDEPAQCVLLIVSGTANPKSAGFKPKPIPVVTSQFKAILARPRRGMTCWPVNTSVGNVKNNSPSLIKLIAAQ